VQGSFDKGRRLVDHIVKKPVGTLVAKTAIDNFSPKIGQTLTLTLAFGWQAAPNPSQTRRCPSVAAAPEGAVLEHLPAIIPDVREQFLGWVSERFR